jgi:hypothetical protein
MNVTGASAGAAEREDIVSNLLLETDQKIYNKFNIIALK